MELLKRKFLSPLQHVFSAELPGRAFSLLQLIHLLRLKHWMKSSFVLIGLIYSGSLNILPVALFAALAFSLLSSAIYIYNDVQDRDADRAHPKKRYRPLASEAISVKMAYQLLFILLIASFGIAVEISLQLTSILLVYLSLNFFYNHWGKKIRGIDVLCIASGFMLRVLAGTIGIGIPISQWLIAAATLVSLFLALSKRCLEKQLGLQVETRLVLKKYNQTMLNIAFILTGLMSLVVYFIYIVFVKNNSFYFLLTLPLALVGLSRFIWLTMHEHQQDDPISLFMHDRLSCFNFVFFIILTGSTLIK